MKRVFLSLGSNLGDREANLREALERLESSRFHITRRSSLYETAPVGPSAQPWYLNLVAEAETTLLPLMLLEYCQRVERTMGRQKLSPKGSRRIDIDILMYGRVVMDTSRLTLPHPHMHERRFVLEPMLELAPGVAHPALRQTMLELFAGVKEQTVHRRPDALKSANA